MRRKILLALIPLSFILGSCRSEDLQLAKSFGSLSEGLANTNQKISTDFYASCTRSATWLARGTTESRENMQERLEICDNIYRPNSQRTKIAGSVLVNYVAAIGNLASKNENGFTLELNQISEALGNLNIEGRTINENTRKAGVSIADFILNLTVKDFRRRNLKLAIVCTDNDIQKYSNSLSEFIDSYYVGFLLNEEIKRINSHFNFYVGEVNERLNQLSTSDDNSQNFRQLQERQTLLESKEREEINKVIERKKEGLAYIDIIRSTAEFHSQLKSIFNKNRTELSNKQIQKCNRFHSDEEQKNVQDIDIENDFTNQKITAGELKQAKKVTKEYIKKVTPLLSRITD